MAKVEDYKILQGHEIELVNTDIDNKYYYELIGDQLRLRNSIKEAYREFRKKPYINAKPIDYLFFSSVSEFSDLEMYINSDSEVQIRINYHRKWEPGNYKGTLPQTLFNFIQHLTNTVDFDVGTKLKPEIHSDIQEWGMKITSEGKEYDFYYNCARVNQNHNDLAILLERVPYFMELENTESIIQLDKIEEYRKNEFKRNIKENDL